LIEKKYYDNKEKLIRTVSFRYDAQGRLESETDVDTDGKPGGNHGERCYIYPDTSPKTKASRIDNLSWGKWVSTELYTYDEHGRLSRVDYHRGAPEATGPTPENNYETIRYVYQTE